SAKSSGLPTALRILSAATSQSKRCRALAQKRRTSGVRGDAGPDAGLAMTHSAVRGAATAPRVVIIPGLNGHPWLLMRYAPLLFPGWQAVAFNHHLDLAQDGVSGLASRALELIDPDEPAFVCGESFGGTVALTLARHAPERVRGLILFSAFG